VAVLAHYELRRVGIQPAAACPPTPAELNKATRQDRDHVPRHQLRRLVRVAANAASHETDFLDRLRSAGLLVRPVLAPPTRTGSRGLPVALPDDRNAAGGRRTSAMRSACSVSSLRPSVARSTAC
jgi:hypothetical protein